MKRISQQDFARCIIQPLWLTYNKHLQHNKNSLITGSIARSASLPVMGVKFGMEEGSPPPCQISAPSVQRQGCRTPKIEIFTQTEMWNINAPRGVSLGDFHKICSVCTSFQGTLGVKILLDLLKGLWSYGGFKLRDLVAPKFSVPLAAKLCVRPQKF